MKRKTLIHALSVLLVLLLVVVSGCSGGGQQASAPEPAENTGNTSGEAAPSAASSFPEKDITVVVPHDAGGGIDTYARAIVPFVQKHLPKEVNIVVENRPGASGVTGSNGIYTAEPDGYTLGFVEPGGLYVQQKLVEVQYDVTKFNWLGQLRYEPLVAFTTKTSKIQSFEDLKNNKVAVSVPQKRTAAGIGAVIAFDQLGIDYGVLAGTGTGDAVTATLRGDADIHLNNTGGVISNVDDGDLIPMVVFSDEPYAPWPDAPTIADLGHPEMANVGVFMAALTAPPGVPEDVLAILREATDKAMADPEFLKWSEESKRPIVTANGEETTKNVNEIAASYEQYMDIVKKVFE